jgi:AcrR family transcriptional regulator
MTTSDDQVTKLEAPARRGPHAERRAAMRRRLLDAAVESLIELGYAGTTTLEVQMRAGVSRGALLHHFASRDDLMVAAVEHLFASRSTALYEKSLALPRGFNRLDRAIELLWEAFDTELSHAIIELWAGANTEPRLAEAVRGHDLEIREQVYRYCDHLVGPEIVADVRYRPFRLTLTQAMTGAAMMHHLRPQEDYDRTIALWQQLARELFGPPPLNASSNGGSANRAAAARRNSAAQAPAGS